MNDQILPLVQSPGHSPLPVEVTRNVTMSFPDAMREVTIGKKVTRLEWADKGWYGFVNGGRLRLHKPEGSLHEWNVTDGDLSGTDWIVV